jgi:hypothetical protein
LVLGDGFQHGAVVVGAAVFRVPADVDSLGGDGDLVHGFPRPLEVRAARLDHADLRVGIALALIGRQRFGNRVVERGGRTNALGPTEAGFDGALVLVDRIQAADQVAGQKPDDETNQAA